MNQHFPRYRWAMATLTWLMMFSLGISWFCFTPMEQILRNELSMNFGQAGLMRAQEQWSPHGRRTTSKQLQTPSIQH